MISFPFLYEDELLYSAFARYHRCSGNENPKHSVEDLYGVKTVCASATFPANLLKLCERLPQSHINNSSVIIDEHTLLPYYAPYLQEDRYLELKRVMSEDNGISIFMKLGRVASTIKSNKYLKYCYECVTEEMKTNGEAFWHRTHQGEGVKVCPKHKTWLIDSIVRYSERKHKHEFVPIELGLYVRESINDVIINNDYEHYLFIAEQTYYLLNNKIEPLGLKKLQKYYVAKVQELGMSSVQGRIRWKELISSFSNYYGKELLQSLNCYVELDKEDTWLHKLLRKPEICCHPLRHILFLGFLGETISKMVSQIDTFSYSPFGDGPWFCLNKTAEHYKEPIVTSCTITRDYKSGLPVGTFSCSCGFVYSRKGPDRTDEDQCKIGRIKNFGSVWEEKLAELAQRGYSLRKMADLLGVDPTTVKKKLTKKVENKQGKNSFKQKEIQENYRNQWMNMMKINEGSSITDIRLQNQKVYMWLYRNDKDWLKEHSHPIPKENHNKSFLRVNWEKRDQELTEVVASIVSDILKEKKPFIKVTKNEIGRRLRGVSSFVKNLDKLPNTMNVLNQSLETTEQFQKRRIKCVVEEMRITHSSIKEWKVIREAGLKTIYANKLKSVITNEVYDSI